MSCPLPTTRLDPRQGMRATSEERADLHDEGGERDAADGPGRVDDHGPPTETQRARTRRPDGDPQGAQAVGVRVAGFRAVRVTPVATVAAATRPAAKTAQWPANVHIRRASEATGSTSCWAMPILK